MMGENHLPVVGRQIPIQPDDVAEPFLERRRVCSKRFPKGGQHVVGHRLVGPQRRLATEDTLAASFERRIKNNRNAANRGIFPVRHERRPTRTDRRMNRIKNNILPRLDPASGDVAKIAQKLPLRKIRIALAFKVGVDNQPVGVPAKQLRHRRFARTGRTDKQNQLGHVAS